MSERHQTQTIRFVIALAQKGGGQNFFRRYMRSEKGLKYVQTL